MEPQQNKYTPPVHTNTGGTTPLSAQGPSSHSELPPPIISEGPGKSYVSPPSRHETTREVLSTIGVLLAALCVAFGLIAWVFQSYEVEGPSMQTTLMNQDRLIVWKVPRTIARITNNAYIPNRGDIVIFIETGLSQFGDQDSKQLIKRVIALPGERVVLSSGVLTVYNADHPEGFVPDTTLGYSPIIDEGDDTRNIDITLAKNQVFVCGDNRPNSLDSRTFGPIDADQIVGKLAIRLLPISEIKKF